MTVVLGDALVRMRPDWDTYKGEFKSGSTGVGADAGKSSGDAYARSFEKNSSSRITTGLKKIAVAAAGLFASRAIYEGASKMVDRASDLNETTSKVGVVFGGAEKRVEKFAQTAVDRIGQTEQSALDAAASFGVFGKAAGLNERENAKFSNSLVRLSSDMASFSNTTPEQAVEALSAALRGESEPIRQYGVLLDDATLKAEAMQLGILKPVKDQAKIKQYYTNVIVAQANYNKAVSDYGKNSIGALKASTALNTAQAGLKKATEGTIPTLTNQQKVLAARSAIMKQTKDAQGDFARTSGGLANQERILSAQSETLKTVIGKGLMPLWQGTAKLLTSKVMPPIIDLAEKWVPRISSRIGSWIKNADPSAMLERVRSVIGGINWSGMSDGSSEAGKSFRDIGAAIKGIDWAKLRESLGEGATDTVKVFATVIGFAADHVDLLAKALPFLVTAFIAYKSAQALNNAVALASIPIDAARVLSMFALASANRSLAAQMAITNGVEQTGMLTRARGTVVTIASTAASVAARGATVAWTAVQWLLNAALTANPIGLVVVGIAALVAGVILAYKHSDKFRAIVDGAFNAVLGAGQKLFGWFKSHWKLLLAIITGPFGIAVYLIAKYWDKIVGGSKKALDTTVSFVTSLPGRYVRALAGLGGLLLGVALAGFAKLTDGAQTRGRQLLDFVTKLPGRILKKFDGLRDDMADVGGNIARGIWDGLKEMSGWLAGQVTQWAKDVLPGPIAKILKIESPSKVAAGQARDYGRGVNKGLDDIKPKVAQKAVELAEKLVDSLKDRLSRKSDLLGDLKTQFADLVGSVSSAFAPDIFSAENLTDLVAAQSTGFDNVTMAEKARKRFQGLKIPGAGDFITQLFQSGNTDLLSQLAAAPRELVASIVDRFNQTNSLAGKLGKAVATDDPQGAKMLDQMAATRLLLKDIRKDLRDALRELKRAQAVERAVEKRERLKKRRKDREDDKDTDSKSDSVNAVQITVNDRSGDPTRTAKETARQLAFAGGG